MTKTYNFQTLAKTFKRDNIGAIYHKIKHANVVITTSRLFSDLEVDVPVLLRSLCGGAKKVKYLRADITSKPKRYAVLADGKFLWLDENVYEPLRLATNPTLVLAGGKRGVYKGYETKTKTFVYVAGGEELHFSSEEQRKIAAINYACGNKALSTHVHGQIDELIQKFAIKEVGRAGKLVDELTQEVIELSKGLAGVLIPEYVNAWHLVAGVRDSLRERYALAASMSFLNDCGLTPMQILKEIDSYPVPEVKLPSESSFVVPAPAKEDFRSALLGDLSVNYVGKLETRVSVAQKIAEIQKGGKMNKVKKERNRLALEAFIKAEQLEELTAEQIKFRFKERRVKV
jgi:hypothetical protein